MPVLPSCREGMRLPSGDLDRRCCPDESLVPATMGDDVADLVARDSLLGGVVTVFLRGVPAAVEADSLGEAALVVEDRRPWDAAVVGPQDVGLTSPGAILEFGV